MTGICERRLFDACAYPLFSSCCTEDSLLLLFALLYHVATRVVLSYLRSFLHTGFLTSTLIQTNLPLTAEKKDN